MKKFIITATTVTVVGLGSVFFTNTANAESVKELENKQTEIQNERQEVKANLSKAEAEIADVLIDLKEINQEIVRVEQALIENQKVVEKTEKNIDKTEKEIADLEAEIADLEESIELRFDKLKERVVAYQQNGGDIQYLEVLFGAKSFVDFISNANAVVQLTNADADILAGIEADKEIVEAKKQEVEEKLIVLNEEKVELEGMAQLIKDQKEEEEAKKSELEEKESKLTSLKADLETKDSNLASLEAQVRADIEIARTPVPEPTPEVASATAAENAGSGNSNNSGNNEAPASSNATKAKPQTQKQSEPSSSTPAPPTGKNISKAITAGNAHLGTPYVWGGKGPGGFDCSGFVSWAFKQAGYSIPSSTAGLQSVGTKVSYSDIRPGDLVFFDTYKTNGHVGIYVGNGNWIGAQNSTGLAIASMDNSYWKSKFNGHVRRVN